MRIAFYFLLKQYCRLALYFFYRKWQVQGKENIPPGPVIFVANHQNAFLDAVLVSCSTQRNPWFLTRASVFGKSWSNVLLGWLRMIPVYRFRDGFASLRKSEQAMERFTDLLQRGESILIFGEGNHAERWTLRQLQKGFARIAIDSEEKSNWRLGVKIIPVGLQYDELHQSGSRVLVSFGKPISVGSDNTITTDKNKQLNNLVQQTTEGLKALMVNLGSVDYAARARYFLSQRTIKKDLVEQLRYDEQLLLSLESGNAIEKPHVKKQFTNPIFWYAYLNTILPRSIILKIIQKKVKDLQFIGSLKFALGMVLVPIFIVLQSLLVFYLLNLAIAVGYAVSVLVAFKLGNTATETIIDG